MTSKRTANSSDYLRAAKIVRYFGESGRSFHALFRIHIPLASKRGHFAIFSHRPSQGFTSKEVYNWEKVIKKHEKSNKNVESMELHSKRKSNNRKTRRLLTLSDRLKKTGVLTRMVEKSVVDPIFDKMKPAEKALYFSHLFIFYEPDYKKRTLELKRIFSYKIELKHETYVKILWDYTRNGIMMKWAAKKTKRYIHEV